MDVTSGDIISALLVLARTYGFLLPFTAYRLPVRAHATLVLACTLAGWLFASDVAVAPGDLPQSQPALSSGGFALLVLAELGAGAILATPFALALELPGMSGRLVDTLRGSLIAEQLLPGTEQRGSTLEALASLLLPAVVLLGGLHHLALDALRRSLRISASGLLDAASATPELFVNLSAAVLGSGALLVAPVLAVLLVVEILIACLTRMLPRVALGAELAPLRLLLGVALALPLLDATEAVHRTTARATAGAEALLDEATVEPSPPARPQTSTAPRPSSGPSRGPESPERLVPPPKLMCLPENGKLRSRMKK